ncbi:HAD hydrolase family protein, partial [Rothia sp. 27098_8_161]
MDGTFLTDSKTFDTERFSRILPRLQALGIHFVVASGNTYAKLQDY